MGGCRPPPPLPFEFRITRVSFCPHKLTTLAQLSTNDAQTNAFLKNSNLTSGGLLFPQLPQFEFWITWSVFAHKRWLGVHKRCTNECCLKKLQFDEWGAVVSPAPPIWMSNNLVSFCAQTLTICAQSSTNDCVPVKLKFDEWGGCRFPPPPF